MGHVDYRSLSQMSKNNLIENLLSMLDHEDVCEVCLLGKRATHSFPTIKAWRANEKVYFIHTDICEHMKTGLPNGSRYFVLFIDDCTRFYWVYFMNNKSEVVYIYFKFKVMVECQSGCKLKMGRLNNGVE